MLPPLVECIPNISDGRDARVIDECVAAVRSVSGIDVLHVDPNPDAHRTVITFVGSPSAVEEAVEALALTTMKLINLESHRGAHPRIGGLDVCPIVPLTRVSMEQCLRLVERVGAKLGAHGLPIYLYEKSATRPEREKLSTIRRGGYEGLAERLLDPKWCPDFGPGTFQPRYGATVLGVRKILIAFNIGLDSSDLQLARRIAAALRSDGSGDAVRTATSLAACRAIGWEMPHYGQVQVSLNLLDFHQTGIAAAYQRVEQLAEEGGTRVIGSELIGLAPLAAMRECALQFQRSGRIGDATLNSSELLERAVLVLGLNCYHPFKLDDRILEYTVARALGLPTESIPDFG